MHVETVRVHGLVIYLFFDFEKFNLHEIGRDLSNVAESVETETYDW